MTTLILGTRGSRLALVQSEMIAALLRKAHPELAVELTIISTQGDRVLDVALSAVGDKGLFVKELEQALLDNQVDLCVHSAKDLPSQLPDGLTLAAFPRRADPRDALVVLAGHPATLSDLPAGAVVGTSSLRRACQLRALRPDLELRDVRGNVDTRLRKLASGQYDGLILAAAGLDRLGLIDANGVIVLEEHRFQLQRLATSEMLPAVAQGTLAIEARSNDPQTLAFLAMLNDPSTAETALAERAFLRRLEGGCQVPIAAYATLNDDLLYLEGLVGSLDGRRQVRGALIGPPSEAQQIGTALAENLLAQGADEILAELAHGG